MGKGQSAGEISNPSSLSSVSQCSLSNLQEEVFDSPWWTGRWDWRPWDQTPVAFLDEEDGSEFEFGEGLDGLPVPQRSPPPTFWSWSSEGASGSTASGFEPSDEV